MRRSTKHSRWLQTSPRMEEGFTLIELIMVVAIGTIILTMGVPSFITTIKNNRLATETNKLVADVNLARSEAIKRGTNVVLCSTANPSASSPTCASSTTWTTGWLLFADDGNNTYDSGTDTLIRVGLAPEGNISFISSDNYLAYAPTGLNNNATTVAIAVCDDRGGEIGRQIQVNTTGRPRLIYGDSVDPVGCSSVSAM